MQDALAEVVDTFVYQFGCSCGICIEFEHGTTDGSTHRIRWKLSRRRLKLRLQPFKSLQLRCRRL